VIILAKTKKSEFAKITKTENGTMNSKQMPYYNSINSYDTEIKRLNNDINRLNKIIKKSKWKKAGKRRR
jgi:hypothetical protein